MLEALGIIGIAVLFDVARTLRRIYRAHEDIRLNRLAGIFQALKETLEYNPILSDFNKARDAELYRVFHGKPRIPDNQG
jgi:hypothetical protein